jgi:peptide chain release factor 1
MLQLAKEELQKLEVELPALAQQLQELLIPRDPDDSRDAILEVRAGTGGEEAALFAQEVARMYQRYAERRGWKMEMLQLSESSTGGVKEAIFSLAGENAFGTLRNESGVHRVQRVPVTESSGRIHTSACSVAVLPEAEEIEVAISPSDLRIDVFRSGGPGGQSVNTTDSAVRITHVPTGMVVICQDEKSQLKNKAKALKVLRARLYEARQREQREKEAAARREQVGTGDRSEKIRTYNYPQSRVTDHRIGFTTHALREVLDGDLDELLQAVVTHFRAQQLARQD